MPDLDDAARRHDWAAATRDVAAAVAVHAQHHGVASPGHLADLIHRRADRIESGALTPWADTPEPATPPAEAAQEPPAAVDPHPDTPDRAAGADDCAFCEIVANRAPATIVREWPDALAVVPLNPVTDGHVLVIPREHVQDATEDPNVAAAAMLRAAQLAEPPCNIITSSGWEATQSVWHLHVHVVPRRAGDGLALPWSTHPDTPPHASGILGRAAYCWTTDTNQGLIVTSDIWARIDGGTREVLLVDPAAWAQRERVIELVQEWRAGHGPQRHCGHCDMVLTWTEAVCGNCGFDEAVLVEMAAAVDALTGGPEAGTVESRRPARLEPCRRDPFSEQAADPTPPVVPLPGITDAERAAWLAEVEQPEPAGDGPGWDRPSITGWIDFLLNGPEKTRDPESADQLTALLAERDQLRRDLTAMTRTTAALVVDAENYRQIAEGAGGAAADMQAERDEAREGAAVWKTKASEWEATARRHEAAAETATSIAARVGAELGQVTEQLDQAYRAMTDAQQQRDTARAELAETESTRRWLGEAYQKQLMEARQAQDALRVERGRTASAERLLAEATAERDRLTGEWAAADATAQDYGTRLDECAAELERVRGALAEWTSGKRQWVRGAITFADGSYTVMEDAERLRRDTAAATLDAFAAQLDNDGHSTVVRLAEIWAAEIRTGQRDTPGMEQT